MYACRKHKHEADKADLPSPIYPWRAAEVFFILWSFANALQLVLSHPHMITSPVKGPKYVASSPRNFGSRFYGETRRSVDAGLDALHLGEQERKSITASVVSTVFMLNSAVGTLVNGILDNEGHVRRGGSPEGFWRLNLGHHFLEVSLGNDEHPQVA